MMNIPKLELKILRIAWGLDGKEFTCRDVHELMPPRTSLPLTPKYSEDSAGELYTHPVRKNWAYTTIKTVVDRLTEKGFFVRTDHSYKKKYKAVISKSEYENWLMAQWQMHGLFQEVTLA